MERIEIRPADRPGDLGWVVMAHGELYAAEFGWGGTMEALVARIEADYGADHDPERECGWIAEVDGRRMGCVFCVAEDEMTAKLRILLVHPDARGRVWAGGWWTGAWTSPGPPATPECGFGRIIRSRSLGGSTSTGVSCSSRSNRAAASVPT